MEKKAWIYFITWFLILLGIVLINATQTQTPETYIVNLTNPTQTLTWNETSLNDSSTSSNVTFTGNQNQTVYIEIPKDSNVLEAKLNLTGYFGDDDTEDAYACSGTFRTSEPCSNAVDENWSTLAKADNSKTCYVYENFTTSSNAVNVNISSKIATSGGGTSYTTVYCKNSTNDWHELFGTGDGGALKIWNESIPSSCISNPIQIRTKIYSDGVTVASYYESKLSFYPTESFLDVSNDGDTEWSFTGEFNHSDNRTSDFSSEIDTYLSTCTADSNGLCDLPLVFHSNTSGNIEISDINITWEQENTNMSQLFLYQDKTSEYEIYWNDSFDIGSNITIDGFYVDNSSTIGYWDDVPYDISYNSGLAWINITPDLVLDYPNTSTESNHTLSDDTMLSVNITLRKNDNSVSDSYVIESDDTITRTYFLNNSGTTEVTSCNLILENRSSSSSSLSSYASFNESDFDVSAGTVKYFTMTLTEVPSSSSIYYQRINATCSGSVVEALMSIDISSSTPTSGGGGGGGSPSSVECGNGICEQPYETPENCPKDCQISNISIIPKKGFTLFSKPNEIKEKTAFGSPLEVLITNLGSNPIIMKVSKSGEDKQILVLNETSYGISGKDSKKIPFKIKSPEFEGIYQASVLIETGTQRISVPIKLTVQKRVSITLGGISFLFYEWNIPLPSGLEVSIPSWVIIFTVILILMIWWMVKK